MIEALWYGLAAALAFMGLVSIIWYIILSVYKPDSNVKYIITVPENCDTENAGKLVYGAYIRNMFLGSLVSTGTTVVDNGLSDEVKCMIEECGGMDICSPDELNELIFGKESDGQQ